MTPRQSANAAPKRNLSLVRRHVPGEQRVVARCNGGIVALHQMHRYNAFRVPMELLLRGCNTKFTRGRQQSRHKNAKDARQVDTNTDHTHRGGCASVAIVRAARVAQYVTVTTGDCRGRQLR